MSNPEHLEESNPKKGILNSNFSIKLVIIPVAVALFIITYEDFLNNVVIQPILYLLDVTGILTLTSGTNEYTLFIILLNLILNFASLILIYYVFFRTKLLSKQVENKQYGLFTTIKTYLSLFALVAGVGILFTTLKNIYFPNVPTTSPYDAIFPSTPNYPLYNLILVILLVCIFAPILEELTFRRILIPMLEGTSFVSTPYAVVISASVFAFIHSEADLLDGSVYFAIVHFTSAFILGLGLAAIYVTTRNVKYSIFYHSMNNTLSMIATIVTAYFITDINNPTPSPILDAYGLFVLFLLIAGIVFLILALFNTDKIKYPLKNQFKSDLNLNQMAIAIIVILALQGIIYIIIPSLENVFFSVINLNTLLEVILNAILYIAIFLLFVIFLRKNLANIFTFGKVQNQNLQPYVDPKHMAFQYMPYGYPNMNQQYPNQPPYQNTYQQYPNQPPYQNMYQQNPNQAPVNNQQRINQQPYQNVNRHNPDQPLVNNQQSTCPNCNKIIPSNQVNFCPHCGFKLK